MRSVLLATLGVLLSCGLAFGGGPDYRSDSHFRLQPPVGWHQVSRATLRRYSSLLGQAESDVEWEAGFQESRANEIIYPYVLVRHLSGDGSNLYRAARAQLQSALEPMAQRIEERLGMWIRGVAIEEPFVDATRGAVLFWLRMHVEVVGEIMGISASFVGREGVAQLNFYARAVDMPRHVTRVAALFHSFAWEPGYAQKGGGVGSEDTSGVSDYLTPLMGNADLASALGLSKLSAGEQAAWNTLLNVMYQMGLKRGLEASTGPALSAENDGDGPVGAPSPPSALALATPGYGYLTRVETSSDHVLKLQNGSIVEVASGFVGYAPAGRSALVYAKRGSWRVWIEGQRSFSCAVLKRPLLDRRVEVREVFVSSISADGSIIKMMNGSVYEVSSIDTVTTRLWIAPVDALLVSGRTLISLDSGDESVEVSKLR